jgi:hypothetical protein
MIDYGQIISDLLSTYLPLLLTAIIAYIGIEVRKFLPMLETKLQHALGAEKYDIAVTLAHDAVIAVEGVTQRPDVKAAAGLKYSMAKKYLLDNLAARNIHIDDSALETLIESAVYQEFNRYKAKPVMTIDEVPPIVAKLMESAPASPPAAPPQASDSPSQDA